VILPSYWFALVRGCHVRVGLFVLITPFGEIVTTCPSSILVEKRILVQGPRSRIVISWLIFEWGAAALTHTK
jgi:hypothetical protein